MSEGEMQSENIAGPSASDAIISMLAAAVIGITVWAGGVGTVAALNYAGEYFEIYPPANELINTIIQTGYVAVPILAGLGAAWFTYRFVIRLP